MHLVEFWIISIFCTLFLPSTCTASRRPKQWRTLRCSAFWVTRHARNGPRFSLHERLLDRPEQGTERVAHLWLTAAPTVMSSALTA